MPRYINVEDALQAHPEFLNEQIDDHDKAIYAKGWNACNSAFYGAIKELPTVSPDEVRGVGKWISVEERLPDDWKPVIAYDPIGYGEIGIAFIIGSLNTVVWRGVGFTNTAYPPGVTHWMPLPEPPMED